MRFYPRDLTVYYIVCGVYGIIARLIELLLVLRRFQDFNGDFTEDVRDFRLVADPSFHPV